MRNPDWNARAFSHQMTAHTNELLTVVAGVNDLNTKLANPGNEYHPYAVDHADEHLRASAQGLREMARKLDGLRPYTAYRPTPNQLAAEALSRYQQAAKDYERALINAGVDAVQLLNGTVAP